MILLSLPAECLDYMCAPPCPLVATVLNYECQQQITKSILQHIYWSWICLERRKLPFIVAGRRIRRETDRMCSDNEAGERMVKQRDKT
jgi:hypothetical protein